MAREGESAPSFSRNRPYGGQCERWTKLQAPSFPQSIKQAQQQHRHSCPAWSPCSWLGRIILHGAAPWLCRAGWGAAQPCSPCSQQALPCAWSQHSACMALARASENAPRRPAGTSQGLGCTWMWLSVMWLAELIYGDVSSVVIMGLRAGGCLWPSLGVSTFVLQR